MVVLALFAALAIGSCRDVEEEYTPEVDCMETVAIRQSSFSAGELSPKALGRTDSPAYGRAGAQMRDFVINPQGSMSRRPGFKHIGACKVIDPFTATERASSTGDFTLIDSAYAAELGRWVAVGMAGGTNPIIVRSDNDGVTWTAAGTIPAVNVSLFSVAWSGSRYVAVGAETGGNSTIFYSVDGDTWTNASAALTGTPDLLSVVWSNRSALFVATGITGNVIITSPTGASWTEQSTSFGGTAIAASPDTDSLIVSSLLGGFGLSQDGGLTWSSISPPTGTAWTPGLSNALFYDNGFFYALGSEGIAPILGVVERGTGDGTWTRVFTAASVQRINGGARFGDFLFVVGEDGLFASSEDGGATWLESNIEALPLFSVEIGNNVAIIVGSTDGADAQLFTMAVDTTQRRLIPFDGSTGPPYMIELGHLYMRFWRNEVAVESSPGMPLEIVTPWVGGEVRALQYAQANDVMYLAHKSAPPQRLTRNSALSFTLADMLDVTGITSTPSSYLFRDGPYQPENPTVGTLTPSAVSGSITVTAAAGVAPFVANDVGRTIRMFYVTNEDAGTGEWGWMVITGFTSTTIVTARVIDDAAGGRDLANTTAVSRWALGAFSATTGYPSAVTFASQRLIFAAVDAEPQNHWASVIASFEEYQPTSFDDIVTEDNGIVFTLATRKLSRVQWLVAVRSLVSGMKTGPFTVQGSDEQASISPIVGGISSRLASEFDASAVQPAVVGDVVVYAQTGGRVIRGIDLRQGVLNQPNLTVLSDHVTQTGVVEMVYAPVPMSVLWAIRTDGKLIGLTIHPEAESFGWHLHTMGGTLSSSTEPPVITVAVLPRSGFDQLYAVVRRTINGSTVEHIEAMQDPFDDTLAGVGKEDAWHLDAAIKYDGAATTTITGLDHLEGETVQVYADGVMQTEKTVVSGAITIDLASVAIVGFDVSATAVFQTVPIRFLEAAMARSAVHEVTLEVLETSGLRIGPDTGNLKAVRLSAGLNTGDIRQQSIAAGSAATDTRPQYVIAAKDALPATILSLTHIPSVEPKAAG